MQKKKKKKQNKNKQKKQQYRPTHVYQRHSFWIQASDSFNKFADFFFLIFHLNIVFRIKQIIRLKDVQIAVKIFFHEKITFTNSI